MALKTFNLDKEAYEKYSEHCREEGISMSKRVNSFIKSEIEKLGLNKKNTKPEVQKVKDKIHPSSMYS